MAHAWKACWVRALRGSNPLSSAVRNSGHGGWQFPNRTAQVRKFSPRSRKVLVTLLGRDTAPWVLRRLAADPVTRRVVNDAADALLDKNQV